MIGGIVEENGVDDVDLWQGNSVDTPKPLRKHLHQHHELEAV